MSLADTARNRPYRFGFVMTTAGGNQTRFLTLRKYAERDPEVECVWAPVTHYLEPDPFRAYPHPLRTRLIVKRQAKPVMEQLRRLDAVMFHLFEAYTACAVRNIVARRPLLVWSQDNPPNSGASKIPEYAHAARAGWRTGLRFRFDLWCARRTALFFPWSRWAGEVLVQDCAVPADRVHPIHVGLDLDLWPCVPKPHPVPNQRPQILFVGGEFVRKGGDLLLEVFAQRFADRADLHLVTKSPPAEAPPNTTIYRDLNANDARLRQLYAAADLFVLPTRADMSSYVALEAMATGLPVITARSGGIPEVVRDGDSGFLIAPGDTTALAERMEQLITDPALRLRMGAQGRAIVERDFSAAVSVPRILETIKRAVDGER